MARDLEALAGLACSAALRGGSIVQEPGLTGGSEIQAKELPGDYVTEAGSGMSVFHRPGSETAHGVSGHHRLPRLRLEPDPTRRLIAYA
jgi:hypothetical protein